MQVVGTLQSVDVFIVFRQRRNLFLPSNLCIGLLPDYVCNICTSYRQIGKSHRKNGGKTPWDGGPRPAVGLPPVGAL